MKKSFLLTIVVVATAALFAPVPEADAKPGVVRAKPGKVSRAKTSVSWAERSIPQTEPGKVYPKPDSGWHRQHKMGRRAPAYYGATYRFTPSEEVHRYINAAPRFYRGDYHRD